MNNINITPTDITQSNLEQWLGQEQLFEPQYLELYGEKKKMMRECVASAIKPMIKVSNLNLMRIPMGFCLKWTRAQRRKGVIKIRTECNLIGLEQLINF